MLVMQLVVVQMGCDGMVAHLLITLKTLRKFSISDKNEEHRSGNAKLLLSTNIQVQR